MKITELREMTVEELKNKVGDLDEERFNLNMRRSYKQLDNPLRLRQIRREVARIKTILIEDAKNIRNLSKVKVSILDVKKSKKKEK